ncbi:kinase-like protein, partial [Stereum hirsutum FP-91666 SS1]|uniref:kinase-like protein n=1 Tax=Stereum hirsutum (strain FP-91666) TaxID=721885 RepID=UPI00044106F0
QYRTGRTLGKGTYSIVKEAFHIESGTRYACKVINKKLIVGREEMFRNEISVLNHISSTHPNIVTLHDYFETAHNLYLCFELCTGGMLLDVFSRRGRYREPDAARLIKNVLSTVSYIHSRGIVHGDLKPSNLLFLTQDDDSEIMIADFGLSRIVDDNTLVAINEICGTPGYMAPEIFQKAEYGKPVDIWAIGVIAFFILGGYQPFRRDNEKAEQHAVVTGDFKFHPPEPWEHVSGTAKDFITLCLTHDPMKRPKALELLNHPWLTAPNAHFQSDPAMPGQPHDLLPFIQKATVECMSRIPSSFYYDVDNGPHYFPLHRP